MRELTIGETEVVSGSEILVSPGQVGIAVTNNTLYVITGTAEAAALLSTIGALSIAFTAGFSLGNGINSVVYDTTGQMPYEWIGDLMGAMANAQQMAAGSCTYWY